MNTTINAIIDLSHHNPPFDWLGVSGILGVIHKASQGIHFTDSMYRPRFAGAVDAGLLWGAYHFGTGDNGRDQAAHFLDIVQPTAQTLLVLDFEENTIGESMRLWHAYDFINKIQADTGRLPAIYGGSYLRQELAGKPDELLTRCPLWVSDYREHQGPEIPAAWSTWSLWQYTDGRNGNHPRELGGIGPVDRNIFNGSEEALRSFWSAQ